MADLQKFCDELREKVSIVDVVGAKVKLIRKGREYQACCPFHNEKTPSFTVNESKGFYHCFGCGAHGDIIKFEMEANNLSFMEAIEKLAEKAGLQVPRDSYAKPEEVEKRNSLYDIMELACKFFEKSLRMPDGVRALDYLAHRGFGDDIIQKLNSHQLITLNHTDVPLVEFDFFVHFDYIHYIVEQLLKNGYRPLIAHPERYFCIIKDPDRVRTLLKMGALIQCNKSSILGHFGLNIKTCVDYLLKEKLVTVVASDSHGIDVRTPDMSEIQFYLDLKYGSKMAELLLESNPKKILKL